MNVRNDNYLNTYRICWHWMLTSIMYAHSTKLYHNYASMLITTIHYIGTTNLISNWEECWKWWLFGYVQNMLTTLNIDSICVPSIYVHNTKLHHHCPPILILTIINYIRTTTLMSYWDECQKWWSLEYMQNMLTLNVDKYMCTIYVCSDHKTSSPPRTHINFSNNQLYWTTTLISNWDE